MGRYQIVDLIWSHTHKSNVKCVCEGLACRKVITWFEIERVWPSRWKWSQGTRWRDFCRRWKIRKPRSESFAWVEEARPDKRFKELSVRNFACLLCSLWEGISSSTSFLVILSAVWLNLAENKKMWQLNTFWGKFFPQSNFDNTKKTIWKGTEINCYCIWNDFTEATKVKCLRFGKFPAWSIRWRGKPPWTAPQGLSCSTQRLAKAPSALERKFNF